MGESAHNQAPPGFSFRDVMVLNSLLMSRSALLSRQSLDPKNRNLDKECGYPEGELTAGNYWDWYCREGIAARVVGVYPDESWSVYPELYEKEEEGETSFEGRWNELLFQNNIWYYLHRVDELSGIGRFGALLLGLDDDRELSEPAKGIDGSGRPRADGNPVELLYLRPFDENNVRISSYETNHKSPRYGQPNTYNFQFVDPTTTSSGNQTFVGKNVHWSRVIHVADNRKSSEIFGMPRMRQVINRLYDIRKILGGSGEMFWKGAFPGYSFETLPNQASELDVDQESVATEFEAYSNGLKRWLALEGMTVKSLAPQVGDPTNHLVQQLTSICATIAVPLRIFLGSEAGHLASSQDADTWNRRLGRRQSTYLTPMLIKPTVDRFQLLRILPKVNKFFVSWTDLNSITGEAKANISLKKTQALMQYVSGAVEQIMPLFQFLTMVLEFTQEQAQVIIESIESEKEKRFTTTGQGLTTTNPRTDQSGVQDGEPSTEKKGRPSGSLEDTSL